MDTRPGRSRAVTYALLVEPFYLRMMGSNAATYGSAIVPDLARAAAQATPDEVTYLLLCGAWREVAMGAWFAHLHGDPQVTAAVLTALTHSAGGLTAPALALAAVTLTGPAAEPALRAYLAADLRRDLGASGAVYAAAAMLRELHGVDLEMPAPPTIERGRFAALRSVGEQLVMEFLAEPTLAEVEGLGGSEPDRPTNRDPPRASDTQQLRQAAQVVRPWWGRLRRRS